jgi:hypothetical protein
MTYAVALLGKKGAYVLVRGLDFAGAVEWLSHSSARHGCSIVTEEGLARMTIRKDLSKCAAYLADCESAERENHD